MGTKLNIFTALIMLLYCVLENDLQILLYIKKDYEVYAQEKLRGRFFKYLNLLAEAQNNVHCCNNCKNLNPVHVLLLYRGGSRSGMRKLP